jgi:predicted ATPase
LTERVFFSYCNEIADASSTMGGFETMHIKEVRVQAFKRFHILDIRDLPASARLVVLAGPNSSGKSSLFDAFNEWDKIHGRGGSYDEDYFMKKGAGIVGRGNNVEINFHETSSSDFQPDAPKTFYIRSAYRNESDFRVDNLQRVGPVHEGAVVDRLIDNDVKVSRNYHRLVSRTLANVYDQQHDALKVAELRNLLIGPLRTSMKRVFDDLLLSGTGDPLQRGTFLFDKGSSKEFPYKNLSGGEKAAFDLLLDLVLKREYYVDTIYCIDEPEAHIGTRLQGSLLEEITQLIPDQCQLWIATHSIGMMRKARELKQAQSNEVVFLDFTDKDFDNYVELSPVEVDRRFWASILDVAVADLAELVAPRTIVLCEGQEFFKDGRRELGFDADCYTKIFGAEFPDTSFVSVGSSNEVESDKLGLARAVELLVSGSKVIRLVDRDDKSLEEIERIGPDIRVLRRRHLEAYLFDDEVLTQLCEVENKSDKAQAAISIKDAGLKDSRDRGHRSDDFKAACRSIVADLKQLLDLKSHGQKSSSFMRDTLAPLIQPGMSVYAELKEDIFGSLIPVSSHPDGNSSSLEGLSASESLTT